MGLAAAVLAIGGAAFAADSSTHNWGDAASPSRAILSHKLEIAPCSLLLESPNEAGFEIVSIVDSTYEDPFYDPTQRPEMDPDGKKPEPKPIPQITDFPQIVPQEIPLETPLKPRKRSPEKEKPKPN